MYLRTTLEDVLLQWVMMSSIFSELEAVVLSNDDATASIT